MKDLVKSARVVSSSDIEEIVAPHNQFLVPCVTSDTCGAEAISAGLVNMPPGKVARAHYHAHSETIVVCTRGHAATLIGPDLVPHPHGPGEFLYIPPGVVHVAVNLSDTADLVALDIRTDPKFSEDMVLTPEFDAAAAEIAARLQRERAAA
ncbi:cupin domain-containing protein [Nocardia sp. NBC_00416]|uniref:cupin domain-containing protein n=1 Tax=Nocardia sp. NBC_00416 TaxID=2975991 RepID=UPI002E1FCD54